MYGVALLIKWTLMLQSAGNVSLKYAVGKTAEVYIHIPAGNKGIGKVLVTFSGTLHGMRRRYRCPQSI